VMEVVESGMGEGETRRGETRRGELIIELI
jgi:hypothetical protein